MSGPSAIDLPPERAFVLHLDGRTVPPRRMAGRAEHITSGRVGHFGSLDELVAFFTSVLAAQPRSRRPASTSAGPRASSNPGRA